MQTPKSHETELDIVFYSGIIDVTLLQDIDNVITDFTIAPDILSLFVLFLTGNTGENAC